jgi:hypothetical protein
MLIGQIAYHYATSAEMYMEGYSEQPCTTNEIVANGISNGWLIYNLHITFDEEESIYRFIGEIRPILFVSI